MRQSPVCKKGVFNYHFLLADTRFLTGPTLVANSYCTTEAGCVESASNRVSINESVACGDSDICDSAIERQ
jgi:hypothetical protein